MVIVAFFLIHWYGALFVQSFFHHRYCAHKMFSISPGWEKFFYILGYILQGSSYLTPRAYGVLHRMHHAYSDTEKDPHSPHFSNNVFQMMWKTRVIYNNLVARSHASYQNYCKDLPEWKAIDDLGESMVSRVGWSIFYILFYVIYAKYWFMYLLLPIHFLMGPVHGAIVNWFGHKLGYTNFDNKDLSKNTLFFDVLMLGELYQNNHHKYAGRPNFAFKWYEFDPIYPVIKFLNFCKIIKLREASEG